MQHTALYDFAPLLRMMLLGVAIASGPLAWVWLRKRQASTGLRLAWLTGLTLFLTFDLVLFGAFTRLTDSGLGCPDWPGCYGSASPLGAGVSIAAAQTAMPTGPVTLSKAWVEMVHRYLATTVGVLILVLALVGWVERRRSPVQWTWSWATLAWVCLQGAFGAWTVTMKLFPAIVTMHLLGGMGLLALLRVQAVRHAQAAGDARWLRAGQWQAATRRALWAVFVLVWLQIALGGWVSTNYAVLACQDFPTCHGQWWPAMDFAKGFELWRELGQQRSGEALPFPALVAVHYTHRLMAYVVLVALLGLAWVFHRREQLTGHARSLLALAAWQLLTGLSNVVLDWPLLAAVSHTGGAAAIVVVLTGYITSMTSSKAGAPGVARSSGAFT